MLLRSSSTPILNSWMPHPRDSSPEHDLQVLHLSRTKSLSLTTPFILSRPHSADEHTRRTTVVATATRDQDSPNCKKKHSKLRYGHAKPTKSQSSVRNNEGQDHQEGECSDPATTPSSAKRLLLTSGLGGGGVDEVVKRESSLQTLVEGGGLGSGGSSGICSGFGGGGDGGGTDGGFGFQGENNSNPGSDSTDAYYRKMIESDPGNALLLGNYARFLKEVRGDLTRAEEYCGRAILANPNDANMLSLYADLVWQTHKDTHRAELYFDRAVKTAPDDSYVLASYAKFLWDTEDEEAEKDESSHPPTPDFFPETPLPPVTATS